MLRIASYVAAWAVIVVLGWVLAASLLFCWLTGLLDDPSFPPFHRVYAFLIYAPYVGRDLMETIWLVVAAAIPTSAVIFVVRAQFNRIGGWRGVARSAAGHNRIRRGDSDNHGHADWMTLERARERFPSAPHPEIGGIVVGEADRVDLGPAAGMHFNPRDRRTWGKGGTAPLLIDHLDHDGPLHSMVIAGTGVYKTTSLATTLLTWRKSRVVLDPSTELGPMLSEALSEQGQRVVQLGIGDKGFNVLRSIDVNDPLAETRIRSIVGRIVGPIPAGRADSTSADFREWGKSIITALLADLVFDPDVPPEHKTLRTLRASLCIPETEMRQALRRIYETSHSQMARQLAANMMDLVEVTWSGALGNATRDTAWLSTKAYADLVSDDAFDARDICRGDSSVFIHVPLESLLETPAIARVLVGSLIDTVIEADGDVDGKVLFALDEAVLLGSMTALKVARDQGRKYGVVLHLLFQSEAQLDEVWGEHGKNAWFDALAWRAYAGVKSIKTSRELSATLGTFPALATSLGQNKGRQGRFMEMASASRGSNTNEHEISRELLKPSEIIQDMRTDERIVIVSGNDRPLRCGTAIGFRRPEISSRLSDNRFAPNIEAA